MRICDWSSDVVSSDLAKPHRGLPATFRRPCCRLIDMTRLGCSRYSPAMRSTALPAPASAGASPQATRPSGIRLPAPPMLLAGIGRAVWIDPEAGDRKSGEEGKRVSARADRGGSRIIKKQTKRQPIRQNDRKY